MKYLNPTIFYRIGVILVLTATGLLALFPVISDDLFMYLAIGKIFFETGHFPVKDPFLFSISQDPWNIMGEWGSYLLFTAIHNLGSWAGLVIFKTIIIIATASLPFVLAKRLKYRSPVTILLVLPAVLAATPRFIERSDLFSTLFIPMVLVLLLSNDHKPGRFIYILPLIFLLWVNLHPGFAVGLTFILIFTVSYLPERKKRQFRVLIWPALASLAACLINPRGLAGLFEPLTVYFHTLPRRTYLYQFNEEIFTFNAKYMHAWDVRIFVCLALLGAALLFLSREKISLRDHILYFAILFLGSSAVRYVAVAVFSFAVLYTWLASKTGLLSLPNQGYRKNKAVMVSLILITAASFVLVLRLYFSGYALGDDRRKPGAGIKREAYPYGAAELITRCNLATPLFNQHDFGAFLAWYFGGERKLFFHGTIDKEYLDFYERDYHGVNRSREEFGRVVEKYHLGAFLLSKMNIDPQNLPLLYDILLDDPDWKLLHEDHISLFFVKDSPENRVFLECAQGRWPR